MNANDFNNLTGRDFANMTKKELRALVSAQASSANRRYQNIKARKDTSKEAVAKVDRSGGRFGVNNKATHKELWAEAKRIQDFNRNPTSNVRGAVQAAEQFERTSNDGKTIKETVRDMVAAAKKEAEKAKGRKLSKTQRKNIERQGRKFEKALREEQKKKWNEFVKSKGYNDKDLELGDSGEDYKQEKPDKSPVDDGNGFEQMQLDYYAEKQREELESQNSPFINVNDETDEDSPFI